MTQSQIKDQDATFRWETYNKVDKFGDTFNTLMDPKSKEFKRVKKILEEKVQTENDFSPKSKQKIDFCHFSLILRW